MNIENKYKEIKETISKDFKGLILTPSFYFNKFRKGTYLEKLNNTFLGVREESVKGSKYIVTIYLQNFFTKDWIKEELFIDKYYNLIDVRNTRG